MTRQRWTPRQRAEETLARATRRLTKAGNTRDAAKAALTAAEAEYDDAVRRRDYAASDPALADDTLPEPDDEDGPEDDGE